VHLAQLNIGYVIRDGMAQYNNMIEHLQRHSLIKSSLHGFVRNRSCLTNLLVFMEEVTNYIDRSYPVDVIYLDFQKAFDKVPYK